MHQVIEFRVDLFDERILICISNTTTILHELFPKSDLSHCTDDHLGLAFGAMHHDNNYRRVIWMKKWSLKVLVHEAFHVTRYILDHVGTTDHETGARLIEYIYNQSVHGRRKLIASNYKNLKNKKA